MYNYQDHIKTIFDAYESNSFKECTVFCRINFLFWLHQMLFFLVCADKCSMDPKCVAYHYNKETHDCVLIPKVDIKSETQTARIMAQTLVKFLIVHLLLELTMLILIASWWAPTIIRFVYLQDSFYADASTQLKIATTGSVDNDRFAWFAIDGQTYDDRIFHSSNFKFRWFAIDLLSAQKVADHNLSIDSKGDQHRNRPQWKGGQSSRVLSGLLKFKSAP